MSKLKVAAFSISLDGYGAGPNQTLQEPLGTGGEELHEWLVHTRTFHQLVGREGGATGANQDFAQRSFHNIGANIMGRNMFGPVRGDWPDGNWKGWWGGNPPFHTPTFVLTHHPRESVEMEGGTVFHFVTGGIHEALERARDAAQGKDIRVNGGVSTIRQYLQADAIDEMHLAVSPILLGSGESLFEGIDLAKAGFRCTERVGTPEALHSVLTKA